MQNSIGSDDIDSSPYLFPWYVHDNKPTLVRDQSILKWEYLEKVANEYVGLTRLCDGSDFLGLFSIYNYLLASPEGDKFCVWRQSTAEEESLSALKIEIFETKNLSPILMADKRALEINGDRSRPFLLNCTPSATFSIPLDPAQPRIRMEFPAELVAFGDFIAVVSIKGLYQGKKSWNNTAMVEVKPNENTVLIHPQDWFNQDERADFGYEWITRAFRSKSTGRIHGQGIRIDPFELDETDRQLTSSSKASRVR